MRGLRIGVIGPRSDAEVLALSKALRQRNVAVRNIDFTGLPGAHTLEVRDTEVTYDNRSLTMLQAMYIRRLRHPLDEARVITAARDEALWLASLDSYIDEIRREREVSALIWSALRMLEAPLINDLETQYVHPRKVHHLRRLASAGVPVPPFVATNDRPALEMFLEAHRPEGVVIKPLRGRLKTQLLESGSPLPLLSAHRPVMIQRCVEGVTVRVYVVAGRPVAAAELTNSGHIDSSVEPHSPRPVELTTKECEVVHLAARAAHLPFTGMDLQRHADGGEVQVLECNASPMFANFCRLTGADVAGPLADYLIDRARGGSIWGER